MADQRQERCETCAFWDDNKNSDRTGECRRRSPRLRVIKRSGGYTEAAFAMWPITDNDDWCGEWRAEVGDG